MPGTRICARVALDSRIFTLQNLDRWPEEGIALRRPREFTPTNREL